MKTSTRMTLFFFLQLSLLNAVGQIKINALEMIWTDSVDSKGNYMKKFGEEAPVGNLIFWIKADCSQDAIQVLNSKGHLPISYKWFQRVGTSWIPKEITHPHGKYYPQVASDSVASSVTVLTWGKVGKNDLRRGKLKVSLRLPDDSLITESIIRIH